MANVPDKHTLDRLQDSVAFRKLLLLLGNIEVSIDLSFHRYVLYQSGVWYIFTKNVFGKPTCILETTSFDEMLNKANELVNEPLSEQTKKP